MYFFAEKKLPTMSLVNYYSSSDDENSNGDGETEVKFNVEDRSVDESTDMSMMTQESEKPETKPSLFSTLPAPKSSEIDEPEESDIKQFPVSAVGMSSTSRGLLNLPAPKKRPAQPIKITAPSLPETNSDDEEEEPSVKKVKPAKTKRNLGHHSLGSPVNNVVASHAISAINHLAAGHGLETRSRCPGLDPNLAVGKKKHATKESDEHTMEELVEFSRNAMEQLHRKLELQRQELAQLSRASGLTPMSNASLLAKGAPAANALSGVAQLQGLAHTLPPGWHFQGNPVLNAALHPGLLPLMQTPGLDPQTNVLGAQTFPFASPLNTDMRNHVNDLTKTLLNPFSLAPVNPTSVGPQSTLSRFPFSSAMGVSQPVAFQTAAPNAHQPSPSADISSETHSNCCSACLKRIDLLEHKVKKILEHLINKELTAVPPVEGPFPVSTTQASPNVSPQVVSLSSNSSCGSSTLSSVVHVGQDLQNAFMQSLRHQEQPNTSLSTTKPKIVFPRQSTDSQMPLNATPATESEYLRQSSDLPIPVKVTPVAKTVYPHLSTNPPIPIKVKPASVNMIPSQPKDLLPHLDIAQMVDSDEKYAYQGLMRYRGTSKLFKIDYERHMAQKSNVHGDHSSDSHHLLAEDFLQMDPNQQPPVIYSASVFESLPPKIQYVLNVVEKDADGRVTRLEVKQNILTSLAPYIKDRSSISRRLADVLFTDDERCFCNCSGWRKPAALDPIRMQALTDAVFKLCPCPEEQKKHLWHECVKSIDAASRHIVRVRKNKGKMPRHGKWLPNLHQDQGDVPNALAAPVETDSSLESIDYDNLPVRLESVLDVTQRDADGRVCKVEIKEPVLIRFTFLANSRLNVACQLADILFAPAERKGASCLGRQGKRQLDPVRVDALREGTFRICPAPPSEQKHLWSYCIKAIDRLSVNPDTSYPTSLATLMGPSDRDQCIDEASFEDGNQSTASE